MIKNVLFVSTLTLSGSVLSLQAATLSGTAFQIAEQGVNLTTEGTLDWALWDSTTSTAVSSKDFTNSQNGGAGIISAITAVDGNGTYTSVRGVTGASQTYTYTDGTSPVSQTDATAGFVINSKLDSLNIGVGLTISGAVGQMYEVDIWTSGFRSRGELTASLNGASDIVLLSRIFGDVGASKESSRFTISFMPDSESDVLNLSYLMVGDSGTSAHTGIQAVAVRAVPEPSTFALLLGAAGMLAAINRRSRRSK